LRSVNRMLFACKTHPETSTNSTIQSHLKLRSIASHTGKDCKPLSHLHAALRALRMTLPMRCPSKKMSSHLMNLKSLTHVTTSNQPSPLMPCHTQRSISHRAAFRALHRPIHPRRHSVSIIPMIPTLLVSLRSLLFTSPLLSSHRQFDSHQRIQESSLRSHPHTIYS
jgi:hypothetical protein